MSLSPSPIVDPPGLTAIDTFFRPNAMKRHKPTTRSHRTLPSSKQHVDTPSYSPCTMSSATANRKPVRPKNNLPRLATQKDVVVVFIHNVPVRFVNQLKLKGLSRSHPVHVATAAVVTHQQRKLKRKKGRERVQSLPSCKIIQAKSQGIF